MSLKLIVKWSGKEFNIENIDPLETVMELKVKIMEQTGVRPERARSGVRADGVRDDAPRAVGREDAAVVVVDRNAHTTIHHVEGVAQTGTRESIGGQGGRRCP